MKWKWASVLGDLAWQVCAKWDNMVQMYPGQQFLLLSFLSFSPRPRLLSPSAPVTLHICPQWHDVQVIHNHIWTDCVRLGGFVCANMTVMSLINSQAAPAAWNYQAWNWYSEELHVICVEMQLCSSCQCFKLCSQTATVKFCEFPLEINNTIKYWSSSIITHMSIIT